MTIRAVTLDRTFAPALSKRLRNRMKLAGVDDNLIPKHSQVLEDVAAALGWNGANALQSRLKGESRRRSPRGPEGVETAAPLATCDAEALARSVLPKRNHDGVIWQGRLAAMARALLPAFTELRDASVLGPTADDAKRLADVDALHGAAKDGHLLGVALREETVGDIRNLLTSLPGYGSKQNPLPTVTRGASTWLQAPTGYR